MNHEDQERELHESEALAAMFDDLSRRRVKMRRAPSDPNSSRHLPQQEPTKRKPGRPRLDEKRTKPRKKIMRYRRGSLLAGQPELV